jgi:integrase
MKAAEARAALHVQQQNVLADIDPKRARDGAKAKALTAAVQEKLGEVAVTLDDLANKWIAGYAAREHSDNGDLVAARYRNHVQPVLGKMRLEDLTTGMFSALLLAIGHSDKPTDAGKGRKRTRGATLTTLKQMYLWGCNNGHCASSPVLTLQGPGLGVKRVVRKRVLSPSEIKELHHRVEHSTMTPRWTHCVWLMLATGTRVFETTLAECAHIDLNAKTWLIPKANQKQVQGSANAEDHWIELSPFALVHAKALVDLARTGDAGTKQVLVKSGIYLFPSRLSAGAEKPADHKTFSHMVGDRQCPEPRKGRTQSSDELVLSGGRWTAHDLRRTMSTGMGELELRPDVIDLCQNHKINSDSPTAITSGMSGTYQHQKVRRLKKQAWLKWGAYLEKLTTEARADTVTNAAIAERAKERLAARFAQQAATARRTKIAKSAAKAGAPKAMKAGAA